jgi:hypothetical protein
MHLLLYELTRFLLSEVQFAADNVLWSDARCVGTSQRSVDEDLKRGSRFRSDRMIRAKLLALFSRSPGVSWAHSLASPSTRAATSLWRWLPTLPVSKRHLMRDTTEIGLDRWQALDREAWGPIAELLLARDAFDSRGEESLAESSGGIVTRLPI